MRLAKDPKAGIRVELNSKASLSGIVRRLVNPGEPAA